jgi:hypothetical protein
LNRSTSVAVVTGDAAPFDAELLALASVYVGNTLAKIKLSVGLNINTLDPVVRLGRKTCIHTDMQKKNINSYIIRLT